MAREENIKVADDWWGGHSEPTQEQKERKRKTGSFYRRDEQVGKFEVRKGKFV